MDVADVYVSFFGDVLARENRHDLKLDLTPPVRYAVYALLGTLGPLFAALLGDDALLYELAALISDPQSPEQPFHPDLPFVDGQGRAVLTAFVALQPIDELMGPTRFVPGSHTTESHAAFNAADEATKLGYLRSQPVALGILDAGDCTLFDARTIHCGGANLSPHRRVVFYLSFHARHAERLKPGTLLYGLREQHSLASLRELPTDA
jgi:ectoine hydroxylase-related dioxygenase (phytanoyl-CoA dioxygenase family)